MLLTSAMATLFDTRDLPPAPPGAARLGMKLFLASLTFLFATTMVGYLILRFRAPAWPPPGWPGLPWALWISSGLVLAASACLVTSNRAFRRSDSSAGQRHLTLAGVLALLFLASQAFSWAQLLGEGAVPQIGLTAWTFYVLTLLHALHVIGGLIPLAVTISRARRGCYDQENHEGVELVGLYFHFLAVVWLVLYAVLAV